MKKSLFAITGAALVLFAALPVSPSEAAGPAFCTAYAAKAVQQNNLNHAKGCGYGGARWQGNAAAHFGWCVGATVGMALAEQNARKNMLQACGSGGGGSKTFGAPKLGGVRLDWCYSWSSQCGPMAAKAFCVSKGYPKAVSFGKANNIGHTRVFQTGALCNNPECDGFTFIKCSH